MKLTRWDLIRAMCRSFYLHAVWNFERMQNVGFLYAMIPVIKKLYPKGNERIQAFKRHLEFFNTHPYMASPLIGVVASMEERMSNGEDVKSEDIIALKSTMAGPLAALGDSFFWGSLRPFTALLGVTIMLWGEGNNRFLGPIFFLLFYNSFHFYMRFTGLWKGYKLETEVIEMIREIDFQGIIRIMHILGLIVLGTIVLFFAYNFPLVKNIFFFWVLIILVIGIKKGISNTLLLYVIILLAFIGKYIGIK